MMPEVAIVMMDDRRWTIIYGQVKAKRVSVARSLILLLKRLPSGDTGVERMPEADPLLAVAPAQIHLAAITYSWEVEQAGGRVLQLGAIGLNGDDRALGADDRGGSDRERRAAQVIVRAALKQRHYLSLNVVQPAPRIDQPADMRPEQREQCIRLCDREIARHQNPHTDRPARRSLGPRR